MKIATKLALLLLIAAVAAPWATAHNFTDQDIAAAANNPQPIECVAPTPASAELPLFQPTFLRLPPPDLCTEGAPCSNRIQCGWDVSGYLGICHNGQCYCY